MTTNTKTKRKTQTTLPPEQLDTICKAVWGKLPYKKLADMLGQNYGATARWKRLGLRGAMLEKFMIGIEREIQQKRDDLAASQQLLAEFKASPALYQT